MAVAVEDPGRKGRFEILRRDVERKVLELLRTHNWVANIEREVGEGEYLIIDAGRAGVSHRITVFYTSATANGAYKQAAAQVEHIFFNGAPYMVESFAHGLDRPVEAIDAFPTLLLQWNAATADGKFAPVANPPLTGAATRRSFRMLQSGMAYIKDGVGIIGVNALHHPNRQRFSAAHELGHHELHAQEIGKAVHVDKEFRVLLRDDVSSQGIDPLEIEANAFASELLMPREFLMSALDAGGLDIEDDAGIEALARKFRVSASTMRYRLAGRF